MPPKKPDNLGIFGEETASRFLISRGFRILTKNYSTRYGEIDIVARKDKTVIFFEVKTRIGDKFGLAEEAIDKRKIKRLQKAISFYLHCHPISDCELRIDALIINFTSDKELIDIRHYPNITG